MDLDFIPHLFCGRARVKLSSALPAPRSNHSQPGLSAPVLLKSSVSALSVFVAYNPSKRFLLACPARLLFFSFRLRRCAYLHVSSRFIPLTLPLTTSFSPLQRSLGLHAPLSPFIDLFLLRLVEGFNSFILSATPFLIYIFTGRVMIEFCPSFEFEALAPQICNPVARAFNIH
jgi:hypothetical protein